MDAPGDPRDPAGLLTRRALLAAGRTAAEVRAATRAGGPLVVVRRGTYVARERWEATDERGRDLLLDRAAHLAVTSPHVLSHDSAARAWGLSLLPGQEQLAHVTRPGVRGARSEGGVKHHLAKGELERAVVDGLPVTGLARTALDLAREHGRRQGLVAVTEVVRRGTTRHRLESVLATMWCWPGTADARRAVEEADPGCESVGEVLLLDLVRELGLGVPVTQLAVRLGSGRLVWCDVAVGPHVVEFDGKVKYRRQDDGGVATADPGEVAWSERRRERGLLEAGLGVSRVVWSDLEGEARTACQARLRREVLATHARVGAALPPALRELNARLRPSRVPWAYADGAAGTRPAM